MPDEARAYWATGVLRGELRTEALPRPGPGEVVVRALCSGISRGTEALVARGAVPESQWRVMRAPFQAGDFPFPVKYGYASVGVVTGGSEPLIGCRVFCLHPHQDRYVVPAVAVSPLPAEVPPGRAVLAANMETALNVVWDAAAQAGERIHVIGAGVVGCLVAYLCGRLPGAEVTLCDVDPRRAVVAAAIRVAFASPDALAEDADLVVHASGHPEGLTTALRCAGVEARIVEASWYGDRMVPLPLGGAFHSRRLTIRASQVGMVAAAMRPRWAHDRRMAKALGLLADPALDGLIDGEVRFEDLPSAMAALAASPTGALCRRIVYAAAS